jgi:diguanylate cyclase (GGDEF)-like protein
MALEPSGRPSAGNGGTNNTVDVLRRVAATAAVHIYEMEYLEDGRYVCNEFIGEGLESLLGPLPEGQDEEQAWEDAVHPDDHAAYLGFNEALRQGRPMELEYRLVGFDRRTRWVWDRARPRFTQGRLLVEGIVTDVTDRHEAGEALADAQRKLAHLAYHDPLTDLPNRLKFSEQLERTLADATRDESSAAVLFVDVDDFKLVNDSLGHAVGDDLLRTLAGRLRQAVRQDDMVARLGGDEFLVLLSMPGESDVSIVRSAAEETAARIRAIVSRPTEAGGVEVFVSASVGIALFPQDAEAGEELLKHADIEMYRAKQIGRESQRTAIRDSDEATDRLAVAGRLRGAVERGEMVLNYQPIIALDSGAMMGVEALIRWNDPVRGLVQPADFIPVAERTGAIGGISDWVVETACAQEREWRAAGLDLFVSVNLPPILWRPKAMRRVIDTIESYGLDPSRLMIEITETAATADSEGVEPLLADLQRRGLGIAIDDFGTGHSSLGRLNHVSVTTIKIDRSFVAGLPSDPSSVAVVESVIKLSRNLGLTPLAEGVETEGQRRFLAAHGCVLGQGFLFSPAVPADEIELLVRRQRPMAA